MVCYIPNFQITNKPYNSILSPDRMKPWISFNAPTFLNEDIDGISDEEENLSTNGEDNE